MAVRRTRRQPADIRRATAVLSLALAGYRENLQRLADDGTLARCGESLCVRLDDRPGPRADGDVLLR